jgi:hypothetical protein
MYLKLMKNKTLFLTILTVLSTPQAFAFEAWRCCPSKADPLGGNKNTCLPSTASDIAIKLVSSTLSKKLAVGTVGQLEASPANKNDFDPYHFKVTEEFNRSYGQRIELINQTNGVHEGDLYQYPNGNLVDLTLKVGSKVFDCVYNTR